MIREALHHDQDPIFEKTASEALERWGYKKQAAACAGELAELCAKLIPYSQGRRASSFAIQEEIADVLITVEQMTRVFFSSPEELHQTIRLKLQKLRVHLNSWDEREKP